MNAIIVSYIKYIEPLANSTLRQDSDLTEISYVQGSNPFSLSLQHTSLNTLEFRVIHNSSIAICYLTMTMFIALHKYVHVFHFILYYEAIVLNSE